MTLSLPVAARAAMLDGFETFMVAGASQATLTVLQGPTVLAVFNLGASSTGTPFGTASGDSLPLAYSNYTVPITNTGTAVAGTANRFVINTQTASTTAIEGTISAVGGGGDIQVPAVTVTAAATQRLNQFTIRMASNGALSVEASLTLV
jgi:hypothetical protein